MGFYLPGGWWPQFADDDPTGKFYIGFYGAGGFKGLLVYATRSDLVSGGWDSATGRFFFTRVRGGTTRTYVGTVSPLLPWPESGLYTLFGNFYDDPVNNGTWMAQTYVIA